MSRPFLLVAPIVAFPLMVFAHHRYFTAIQQNRLLQCVSEALADERFAGVRKDRIRYLDFALEGWVSEPELREEARRRVAAISGLRCREQDNHLYVPARLNAELTGTRVILSGWMHDEQAVREVTRWLKQARPELTVDATGVRSARCVQRVDSPFGGSGSSPPAVFAKVWNLIRVPASLRIVKTEKGLRASGALPSEALRDVVIDSLKAAQARSVIESDELKAGSFVDPASFTREDQLPALLQSFFSSPGAEWFETDGALVRIKACATPEMEAEWRRLMAPLFRESSLETEIQVLPSIYHFPGYVPESVLSPPALEVLEDALKLAGYRFESGELSVTSELSAKLGFAARAIVAAGTGARIIVGVHPDSVDDPKLNEFAARKRAENVTAFLKQRGVPVAQLETVVFGVTTAPNGAGHGRILELLVK